MTSQGPKVGKGKDRTRAPLCLPQQRAPSPAAPAQTQPAIGVRSRAPSCKAPATAEPQMARPPGKRYSTCTSEFECSATGGGGQNAATGSPRAAHPLPHKVSAGAWPEGRCRA